MHRSVAIEASRGKTGESKLFLSGSAPRGISNKPTLVIRFGQGGNQQLVLHFSPLRSRPSIEGACTGVPTERLLVWFVQRLKKIIKTEKNPQRKQELRQELVKLVSDLSSPSLWSARNPSLVLHIDSIPVDIVCAVSRSDTLELGRIDRSNYC